MSEANLNGDSSAGCASVNPTKKGPDSSTGLSAVLIHRHGRYRFSRHKLANSYSNPRKLPASHLAAIGHCQPGDHLAVVDEVPQAEQRGS